ncbi:MAG TPA: ATP-binding protein [Bryobacterales bacterium]|nr:ATP-binding protein [Bryobacterales bacterium]
MAAEVEITVVSHPRWLRVIRSVLAEYAESKGLDSQSAHEVVLAVDEAAANVIKHSYQGDPGGRVTVAASEIAGGIEVEIIDNGEPFNPIRHPVPAPDEIRAGGRGVFLMQAAMDSVEYEQRDGRNCVRMKKLLKAHAE